jgi:hypothetical protein
MEVKHAEQTNNCEATRKYSISWGKHPKVETETGTCRLYAKVVFCKDSKTRKCQSCATSLLNERLTFQVQFRVVCSNDTEE